MKSKITKKAAIGTRLLVWKKRTPEGLDASLMTSLCQTCYLLNLFGLLTHMPKLKILI